MLLYRSIDEIKKVNLFTDMIILAEEKFDLPLKTLNADNYKIVPFWRIMAIDKAAQHNTFEHSNVVMSLPWLFFGTGSRIQNNKCRDLPCRVSEKSIKSIFRMKEMKDNSVVLSPYEQTISHHGLPLLPWDFWKMLADALKKNGLYVFTNANGRTETVIEGTEQFFPQIGELAGAVEYAGYCVSLRSGFSDWISSASLKREVVLYPNNSFYNDYNLKTLWGKKNVLEYIYGESNIDCNELVKTIVDYLFEEHENHDILPASKDD